MVFTQFLSSSQQRLRLLSVATFLSGALGLSGFNAAPALAFPDIGVRALEAFNDAQIYNLQGDDTNFEKALRHANSLVTLYPGQVWLAITLAEQGRFPAARQLLESLKTDDTHFGTKEHNLALRHYAYARITSFERDNATMQRELEAALQLKPELQVAKDLLARVKYTNAQQRCVRPHEEMKQWSEPELLACLHLPSTDPSLHRVVFEVGEKRLFRACGNTCEGDPIEPLLSSAKQKQLSVLLAYMKSSSTESSEALKPFLKSSDDFTKRTAMMALAYHFKSRKLSAAQRSKWTRGLIALQPKVQEPQGLVSAARSFTNAAQSCRLAVSH